MATLKDKAQDILDEKVAKILPENIREGVQVYNVVGTLKEKIDTSDATAQASDIAYGKTVYVNDEKITGNVFTIPSDSGYTLNYASCGKYEETDDFTITAQASADVLYRNGANVYVDVPVGNIQETYKITGDKILAGQTIAKVEGTATSDADAIASDMLSDKTAYVNGEKITGTMESYTAGNTLNGDLGLNTPTIKSTIVLFTPKASGYIENGVTTLYVAKSTLASDLGITSEKILDGKTILGVEGTGKLGYRNFATIEEMNSYTDLDADELVVVYEYLPQVTKAGDKFKTITFKADMGTTIEHYNVKAIYKPLNNSDNFTVVADGALPTETLTITTNYGVLTLTYASGVLTGYTTTETVGDYIIQNDDGSITLKLDYVCYIYESLNDNGIATMNRLTSFEEDSRFYGIYKFNGTDYELVSNQLTATTDDIVAGKTAFTSDGIVTGSYIQEIPNTIAYAFPKLATYINNTVNFPDYLYLPEIKDVISDESMVQFEYTDDLGASQYLSSLPLGIPYAEIFKLFPYVFVTVREYYTTVPEAYNYAVSIWFDKNPFKVAISKSETVDSEGNTVTEVTYTPTLLASQTSIGTISYYCSFDEFVEVVPSNFVEQCTLGIVEKTTDGSLGSSTGTVDGEHIALYGNVIIEDNTGENLFNLI